MKYTSEILDMFIPAIWDVSRLDVRDPQAPDPDMPRRKGSPTASNDTWAVLADLDRAAHSLTLEERQVLFLRRGEDKSIVDTARILGVGRETVRRRYDSAYAKMLAFLNGEPPPDATE